MTSPPTDDTGWELVVSGGLDRHAAEALRLELRRLASQHGVDVSVRVERAEGKRGPSA